MLNWYSKRNAESALEPNKDGRILKLNNFFLAKYDNVFN